MKAKVLVLIGSASRGSSNAKLMELFAELTTQDLEVVIHEELDSLPHFDPSLTESLPFAVSELFSSIESADGLIICSPEYIFSVPARLKNVLEWCVATTVFSNKPVGLITASAQGVHGHAQLKLIMKTLGARLSEGAELIIPGIKGKFDAQNQLSDPGIIEILEGFASGFIGLINN